MPIWLTGKLISYAVGGILLAGIGIKIYSSVQNYFIGIDNIRVELSNERARANRAEVSLIQLQTVVRLEEQHSEDRAQIRAEHQQEINDIRNQAEASKEVLADRERLNRVVNAKPNLVESLSNKATEKVFDDLETIINQ